MKEYFKPFFNPWHYELNQYKELWAWKCTIKNWLFSNPRHLFRWIKWFFQRGSRGYADSDWWGMDSYLCEVIIPMLKELKEYKHGVPNPAEKDFDVAEHEWNANLDKMIEGFEAARRVVSDEYFEETDDVEEWFKLSKADIKIFEKNMKVFTKWFFGLWD